MAVIELNALPQGAIKNGSLNMGTQNDLSFVYVSALHDESPVAVDDIVILKKWNPATSSQDIIYKGIVRKCPRGLSNEEFLVECVGAEFALESQPWEAVNFSYNDIGTCGARAIDQTIEQALQFEFNENATGPQDWFTDIVFPSSVGDLLCSATVTYQKSFLTFINDLIALYPNVKWTIEYDITATTLFPIGKLILIDTSAGRTTRTLQVGGASPDVVDHKIVSDATETAENIQCYGRGEFTERQEILVPDWEPEDELIPVSYSFDAPDTRGKLSYLRFQIGMKELSSVPVITMLVDEYGPTPITLHYMKDFSINFELGAIHWLESAYWINQDTGVMSSDINGAAPGASPPWRRLAAFNGNHLNKEVTISYTLMGPDCFRRYRTAYPVADLRLAMTTVPDPANPGDAIVTGIMKEPVLECYTPMIELAARTETNFPGHIAKKYTPTNPVVNRATQDTLGNTSFETIGPGGVQPLNLIDDSYCVPTDTPGYQEGSKCIYFETRQLGMRMPTFWPDGYTPPTPWFTWDVAIIYTSWENLVQTRTGSAGLGLYARSVFNSVIKYTNIEGDVVQDNSAKLVTVADRLEEYYGAPNWTGTIQVHLAKHAGTKLPIIPFNVGDKILLAGEIDSDISTNFVGIVAAMDISAVLTDTALLTLTISRREPKRNPFVQRPAGFVDAEALAMKPSDVFGLQKL